MCPTHNIQTTKIWTNLHLIKPKFGQIWPQKPQFWQKKCNYFDNYNQFVLLITFKSPKNGQMCTSLDQNLDKFDLKNLNFDKNYTI